MAGVKKILVIKLRQLGDVLLTGPVFTALKRALPQAEIDAYIYEEGRPILEGHPAISEILGYDRRWKGEGRVRCLIREGSLLWKIRRKRYDCVLNLTEGDRGALAARVSRAKIKVGFEPKGKWQRRVYTHLVKHGPALRHVVEKNLDVVRRMGIFPLLEERELFFHVPEKVRRRVEEQVGKEPFVLVHPTSRWRFKCYPVEKMRLLVEWLLEKGKRVVLTSGPDPGEKEMVAQIAYQLPVLNFAGAISLKELAALIERSECLISVDSVPFHMASALKKKVVALFGPTSDVTWGPWRNPYARVVAQTLSCRPCYQDGCGGSKQSDCLQTLPLELVQRAISELEVLSEISAPRLRMGDELIHGSR